MNVLRAIVGILGLVVLGLVLWAAFAMRDLHGGFIEQLNVLTTLPWGLATLVDLAVGFVLFAIIVFLTERSWIVAALWAAPILLLGNFWAAIWLVVRLPHLAKMLSRSDWPGS